MKVGVVFVNYNGDDLLKLTIESCLRAKTEIDWEFCVVDNGSSPENCLKVQEILEDVKQRYSKRIGYFIPVGENRGFSGGNNIGIQFFMEKSDITHIYLLNTDVIVTDYWLELLIQENVSVATPVTNVANTLQAITVDIAPPCNEYAFPIVNEFASYRKRIYQNSRIQAEQIIFFAVMLSKNVIEQVGLLDERFFPGNFEDDDYCLRLKNANIDIWIMRNCYVHHWGSATFGKIESARAAQMFSDNRYKFEQKWDKKWKDPSFQRAASCRLDLQYLFDQKITDPRAYRLIDAGLIDIEHRIAQYCDEIDYLRNGKRPYKEIFLQLRRRSLNH